MKLFGGLLIAASIFAFAVVMLLSTLLGDAAELVL